MQRSLIYVDVLKDVTHLLTFCEVFIFIMTV